MRAGIGTHLRITIGGQANQLEVRMANDTQQRGSPHGVRYPLLR